MSHDPAKRAKNLKKHQVDLPRCLEVFDYPMLTREDGREYGEQRFISLGLMRGVVVVLVWTDREDGPRLISCREALPYEQETYFITYPQG
ncbi:MAG: BrnT family toxin [Pseudomonadales bacterium]|jgi:uncharacterized DUF497 family protein|nr:BrnT family toxin [Pseudomonadales bacterium]